LKFFTHILFSVGFVFENRANSLIFSNFGGGGKLLIISELEWLEASEGLKLKDIEKPLLCSFEHDNGFLSLLRNLYADFVGVRVSLFFHNNCCG